jgi:hypothetical protein
MTCRKRQKRCDLVVVLFHGTRAMYTRGIAELPFPSSCQTRRAVIADVIRSVLTSIWMTLTLPKPLTMAIPTTYVAVACGAATAAHACLRCLTPLH